MLNVLYLHVKAVQSFEKTALVKSYSSLMLVFLFNYIMLRVSRYQQETGKFTRVINNVLNIYIPTHFSSYGKIYKLNTSIITISHYISKYGLNLTN